MTKWLDLGMLTQHSQLVESGNYVCFFLSIGDSIRCVEATSTIRCVRCIGDS